ncbi:MAG TPA: SDR family oxidoreductase [Alphaproteobacteria bacterium]|nr:SDR family oxidoreductase [Alphaproteobacteria bacterium]
MRGLKGKVAVIVGAATGIGRATALRLGEEGVALALGDVNVGGIEAVAKQVDGAGGRAVARGCDISDDASVKALVDLAVKSYGGVDFMHANAADLSLCMRDTDAVEVPLDLFDRTIAVNLRGHLLCTRHAVPEMLKRGGGAIVYTSSGAAYAGEPERVAYAVSKSGINALMRHVASRWGKAGIRSNAIAPGVVMTENALANMPEEMRAAILQMGRSTRLGRPEDIASMVALLFSDDGEWINGQVVSVDGGVTMRA